MKNESENIGTLKRFWEMIERIIISKSTIDLLKINEVTDRLLKNVEERDKLGLSLRLMEYQLLKTDSKH